MKEGMALRQFNVHELPRHQSAERFGMDDGRKFAWASATISIIFSFSGRIKNLNTIYA